MKTRTEKIHFLKAVEAGQIDPIRDKMKCWLFLDGQYYRVSKTGERIRFSPEQFKKINGPNDFVLFMNGHEPGDCRGRVITWDETKNYNIQPEGLKIGITSTKAMDAIINLKNDNHDKQI